MTMKKVKIAHPNEKNKKIVWTTDKYMVSLFAYGRASKDVDIHALTGKLFLKKGNEKKKEEVPIQFTLWTRHLTKSDDSFWAIRFWDVPTTTNLDTYTLEVYEGTTLLPGGHLEGLTVEILPTQKFEIRILDPQSGEVCSPFLATGWTDAQGPVSASLSGAVSAQGQTIQNGPGAWAVCFDEVTMSGQCTLTANVGNQQDKVCICVLRSDDTPCSASS
jgi:hypothetical protein